MRRRFIAILAVAVLLAVLPAAALADGTGPQAQTVMTSNELDVESGVTWCPSTTLPCNNEPGSATQYYASVDVYRYGETNVAYGTPDEIRASCGKSWTDASGVYHSSSIEATVYSPVFGYVSLNNSGSESNTRADVTLNAFGWDGATQVHVQGHGIFDNNQDMTLPGTGFTVTITGLVYQETFSPSSGPSESYAMGTMTCSTVPPVSLNSTVTYNNGEGEIETFLP